MTKEYFSAGSAINLHQKHDFHRSFFEKENFCSLVFKHCKCIPRGRSSETSFKRALNYFPNDSFVEFCHIVFEIIIKITLNMRALWSNFSRKMNQIIFGIFLKSSGHDSIPLVCQIGPNEPSQDLITRKYIHVTLQHTWEIKSRMQSSLPQLHPLI